MSYGRPSATNPTAVSKPQHIPASEMSRVGQSYSPSPEHPGERQQTALQYVNHANLPSQGGYVYMAEPGILRGVSDVDVDEKPHVVYETMAEVRVAKQHMMNREGGGAFKPANEKIVTDYSSTGCVKSRRGNESLVLLIKIIWNVFLFVLVAGAFALSVYTFLDRNQAVGGSGPIATEPPSTDTSPNVQDTQAQLRELNDTIAELRAQIDHVSATHEDRYAALNASIVSAVQSVQTVVPTDELDLYAGCMTERGQCTLVHTDVGTTPGRTSCETLPVTLTLEGFTNTDLYCHIDNSGRETNPITSSLNIFSGEVSCLCSLVALSTPTADPVCHLVIRRCPNTIRLNTTNMR